jgi:uncharacterized membrane protein
VTRKRLAPLLVASLVLGVGLGGFVDWLVMYRLGQTWDGGLLAVAWAATLAGIVLLFQAGRFVHHVWSGRVLAGGLIAGWGLFNLGDGLIAQQLLGLHRVYPGAQRLAWDLAFLLVGGLGPIAAGGLMIRGVRDYTWGPNASTSSPPVLALVRPARTGTH